MKTMVSVCGKNVEAEVVTVDLSNNKEHIRWVTKIVEEDIKYEILPMLDRSKKLTPKKACKLYADYCTEINSIYQPDWHGPMVIKAFKKFKMLKETK